MLICSFYLPTYLVVFIFLLHVVSRYIRYSLTDDRKGALKVPTCEYLRLWSGQMPNPRYVLMICLGRSEYV